MLGSCVISFSFPTALLHCEWEILWNTPASMAAQVLLSGPVQCCVPAVGERNHRIDRRRMIQKTRCEECSRKKSLLRYRVPIRTKFGSRILVPTNGRDGTALRSELIVPRCMLFAKVLYDYELSHRIPTNTVGSALQNPA